MSQVEVIFHTFPLCSVDGSPLADLRAVYSGGLTAEEMQAAIAEGKAPTADVYARLRLDMETATIDRLRAELGYLFSDMLASESFIDGLWALFERAGAL